MDPIARNTQFSCTPDGGGSGGCPDQIITTRGVPNACLVEYMRDHYVDGSLIWNAAPLVLAKDPVDGCSDCPRTNGATAGGSVTFISGNIFDVDYCPSAGFVMLFAEESPACSSDRANYQEINFVPFTSNIVTNIVGAPIYGFAVNVPDTATIEDFSGIVILFNHKENLLVLGRYTNANLKNGDLPITIDAISLGTIPIEMVAFTLVNGQPSGGIPTLVVSIENSSSIVYQSFDITTPLPEAASKPVGQGLFYVGNTTPGVHSATIHWTTGNQAQALVWHNSV